MSDLLLLAIKAATWLASPLGAVLTVLSLALLLRRWRGPLLALGLVVLAASSLPWTAHQIVAPLERQALQMEAAAPVVCNQASAEGGPQWGVLLGGSTRPEGPPERPRPDLNTAADRLTEAARLMHLDPGLRMLVSGGRMIGSDPMIPTEAASMKALLVGLGIAPERIVEEGESRTTRENAARVAEQLRAIDAPILLITSASHLPRSVQNFEAAGLQVCPHPADFRAGLSDLPLRAQWTPREYALLDTASAVKEWLAKLLNY